MTPGGTMLLAVDTTSFSGGLALWSGGEVAECAALESREGFGHLIYQEIQALLARHGAAPPAVDVYAAASGPGSFTGIRVGLSAVKALAEVHGKPVIPVSNLLALAAAGCGPLRAPVMDARRGEVYAAVYDERLEAVVPEVAARWTDFLELIDRREVTFVAQRAELFEPGGAAPLEGAWADARRVIPDEPLAAWVARAAAEQFRRGRVLPPEAVEANYVRRADAELKWRDPR